MGNPAVKTLGDIVTPKQLWMIRNLCREVGADAEGEAEERFGCKLEELSKRQASQLIEAFKDTDGGEAKGSSQEPEPSETAADAAKPQDKEPRRCARPIAEIIADLKRPLAARHLKTKPATKQGGQITYIEWHTAVKYLDLFAPGWSYHVKSLQLIGNLVAVIASISIPCAEGVVTREATGCEEADAKGYGDACSNAEAMALKRAAAKFNLGLYLYSK